MKSAHRKGQLADRRAKRRTSANSKFACVMLALESVNNAPTFTDPIVEQLLQCPEAFKAGELVGKMFDTLKYDRDDSEGGNRLLPPAGVVLPLV